MPYVESDRALARVIGVSLRAVQVAEERGRITRDEADGRWEVLAVCIDWRRNTDPYQRRGVPPAWLDADQPFESALVRALLERVDAEAG